MTKPTDAATKEAYETAIRSFTEAEIALREIVAAVGRYRSASDAVVEAGATLNSSRDSLLITLATLEAAASGMERVSSSLGQAAAVIAALDPERFWASFAQLEADARSSSEGTQQALATSTALLEATMVDSSKALGDRIADARAEQAATTKASTDHLQGRIDAGVSDLTAAGKASTGQLQDRIDAAVANLTAINKAATNEMAAAVSENRRIAIQTRAVAVAAVVTVAVAVVMLVVLLLR